MRNKQFGPVLGQLHFQFAAFWRATCPCTTLIPAWAKHPLKVAGRASKESRGCCKSTTRAMRPLEAPNYGLCLAYFSRTSGIRNSTGSQLSSDTSSVGCCKTHPGRSRSSLGFGALSPWSGLVHTIPIAALLPSRTGEPDMPLSMSAEGFLKVNRPPPCLTMKRFHLPREALPHYCTSGKMN